MSGDIMPEIDLHYLDLLQEECAELIVAIAKIKRFGLHDFYEGKSNKTRLMEEAGDVLAIMNKLRLIADFEAGDACGLSPNDRFITELEMAYVNKFEKLKVYGPDGSYIKSTNTV